MGIVMAIKLCRNWDMVFPITMIFQSTFRTGTVLLIIFFNGENDDQPLDFRVPCFQINPDLIWGQMMPVYTLI